MNNNGDGYFWGMHMFGWFIMFILIFAIVVWFSRYRRRK